VARNAWYASIPRDVDVEMTKNGNRPKYIVRDERRLTSVESAKGDEATLIGLGIK